MGRAADPPGTAAAAPATIVLVEADSFVAGYIVSALKGCMTERVDRYVSAAQALGDLRARRPAAACLNLDADDDQIVPLAEELGRYRVPFVFTTGHAFPDVPPHLARIPVLIKPLAAFQVCDAIRQLIRA